MKFDCAPDAFVCGPVIADSAGWKPVIVEVFVHRDLNILRDLPRVMTECGLLVGGVLLILAWLRVVPGFGSGCYVGRHFHHEDWLGGYGSFKRRLYRLGHISP